MNQAPKRSNEPFFWGLFGAGGTYSAIFAPIIILLIGIILPFANSELVLAIASPANTILGKLFLLLMVILPIWCSMHRIHHATHDLKIHIPAGKLLFYGIATVLSAVAILAIFTS